ncbi:Pet127-domain-containing protein [Ganoderma leucocontextum]|nr:Pet127-domain-containing protein [Ganoderma leucocontextum]
MHLRSLPRWSSLAPRAHAASSSFRASSAAYSTSAIESSRDEESTGKLLEAFQSMADKDTDGNGKGKGKHDEIVKEVVVGIAAHGDAAVPAAKKKPGRRIFKPMEDMDKSKSSSSSSGVPIQWGIRPDGKFRSLEDVNKYQKNHVPRLAHGLEKVLSRPGVHWLQDPNTKEYNFDNYVEKIPQVSDFAFDRLPGFVPSSQDKALVAYARQAQCKYVGSTSSLTGILTQIYLLLSEEKLVNLCNLSTDFVDAPRFFTPGQRIPASVILQNQNGVYTTDYDSSRDECKEDIILLPLGTLLEKFLTLPKNTFSKFLKSHTKDNHPTLKDVHRYAKHGKFLMRSQLDCVDDSLPGTGVFDLKTRAISPIRHDVRNYVNYLDVGLATLTGRRGSFEEEYFDMIRAAFLEYSFQARIGNMDGILVAYHNTARIFGFQYVSLNEMDLCLFGREGAGTQVFQRCIWIMEMLYEQITKCFPKQSVKSTFEKRGKHLYVWVEPVVNPNPKAEPRVVELRLSLTNMIHGKPAKGPFAVHTSTPWSIQYRLERFDRPQRDIIARRQRAYRRQEAMESSLPDAELTTDVAKATVEDSDKDDQELTAQPEIVTAPVEGGNDAQTAPPA